MVNKKEEAGLNMVAQVAKGGGKTDNSIEHIRELLVGKLARALKQQLEEVREEMSKNDQELREFSNDIDRRHTKATEEDQQRTKQLVDEASSRFLQKLDTINADLEGRTSEIGVRLNNIDNSLDATEVRLRETFTERLDDISAQTMDQATKLAATVKTIAEDLAARLARQKEQLGGEMTSLSGNTEKQLKVLRDDTNALIDNTSTVLKAAVTTLNKDVETNLADIRAAGDKRYTELNNSLKDLERRLRTEVERDVAELSTRLLKRIETADNVFAARATEIEKQVDSFRSRLEERLGQFQNAVDAENQNLREAISQAQDNAESYTRRTIRDLETRIVFREDIGNMFIELGMRMNKSNGSESMFAAIGGAASGNMGSGVNGEPGLGDILTLEGAEDFGDDTTPVNSTDDLEDADPPPEVEEVKFPKKSAVLNV